MAVPVWARLVSPGGALVRAELLTPYVVELLADDALRAGPDARLEIRLGPGADEADVARLRRELASLGRRGVDVSLV
jgi:hypothetical protein